MTIPSSTAGWRFPRPARSPYSPAGSNSAKAFSPPWRRLPPTNSMSQSRASRCVPGTPKCAQRRLHRRQPIDSIRRCRPAAGLRRRAGSVPRTGRQGPRLQGERIVHPRRQHLSRRHVNRTGLLDARRRGRSLRQSDRNRRSQSASPTLKISARAGPPRSSGQGFWRRQSSSTICSSTAWCTPRVVRQPNRGATIGAIDEAAIQARGERPDRHSCATAIFSPSSATTKRLSMRRRLPRSTMLPGKMWKHRAAPTGSQLAVAAPGDRPCLRRPEPAEPQGRERFERTYTRGYLAHASISPSCGLALFQDGKLTVWTHCQGVYPLRAALAKTLKLEPSSIIVHHVQGSGCYGHNGADDAAADAAIIAMQKPGSRSACAGGARKNSSTSRRRRR